MKILSKKRAGFTLIEVLLVVAIIYIGFWKTVLGVLGAIIIIPFAIAIIFGLIFALTVVCVAIVDWIEKL